MKILVTGGAGFIASHIVDAYISLGHKVAVIDDLSSGRREFVNKKAKFYEVDICDTQKIRTIFKEEKPDILNHHAAQMSVSASVKDPQFDAQVNLLGLLNLLEAGKNNGLKKVIFASSGGTVYGDVKKLPTPENYTPLQPISPYGIAKLASEYYLYFYYKTHGISYIALRYSNVYGSRQNPHGEAGVVAVFSLKLLKRKKPTINGDGLQTRDYVYVGDVVEANKLALETNYIGAVNIGTGKETNVVEIYKLIRGATGVDIDSVHGPAKPGEQKRSCLEVSLAKEKLDWEPSVGLEEGIKKTVGYFKAGK